MDIYFIAIAALCLGYAVVVSLLSFVSAFAKHRNPYTTYVDKSPNAQAGSRRNFFFGPGYHQITIISKETIAILKNYLGKLHKWLSVITGNHKDDRVIRLMTLIYFGIEVFCTCVLGLVWMGALSAILLIALLVGSLGFYVCFSLLWSVDRLFLAIKSISSRCPTCKRVSVVPVFECASCGTKHNKLTPGPYGVIARKCICGAELPTTIFSGRSRLVPSCPYCSSGIAASDTRQFGIQLVGGTSAGKTTFLVSFWHCYLDASKSVPNLSIQTVPQDDFDDLEYWFGRGMSVSTAQTNANMYSAIQTLPDKTPLQFSIYDIAGEAFARLEASIQQQQFQYCEGVVFLIDPTAPVETAEETLTGFLGAFKALKGKGSMKLSSIPAALVISKADLFKREIGLVKIRNEYSKNARLNSDSKGNPDFGTARDSICRTFLQTHGFTNAMNLLAGEFKEFAIFPASAMGHEAKDGDSYVPWGVMEPIFWIMKQAGDQDKAYFLPVETAFAAKGSEVVFS